MKEVIYDMSYREFILAFFTLISGLACTNILNGLGVIIKRQREIRIDWVCFWAPFMALLTIGDYWFHSYRMDFTFAKDSIVIFFFTLAPSCILFFNTLIIFPRESEFVYDYVRFFRKNIRYSVLTYALFIISLIIQLVLLGFMLKGLMFVLLVVLLACIWIYRANTVRVYKIASIIAVVLNMFRWFYEGIL